MADKVKFGVKNLHYAVLTETESGGVISYTYGTPVPIRGSVAITFDPAGEETPFWADDMKYFNVYKNNGYSGSLEVAYFPESIYTDVFGDTVDATDKVRLESDGVTPKHVALLFEEEGDAEGTKFLFYDCTLQRPNRQLNTTTESVSPQTQSISFTANVRGDKKVLLTTTPETPDSVKNAWYTAVKDL